MSGSYVFEFQSGISTDQLTVQLEKRWTGDQVEVMPSPVHNGFMLCILDCADPGKEEREAIRAIVGVIFAASTNGEVWYYRWFDTIEDAWDYPAELEVHRIFDSAFAPAIYSGLQYRYRLKPEADANSVST